MPCRKSSENRSEKESKMDHLSLKISIIRNKETLFPHLKFNDMAFDAFADGIAELTEQILNGLSKQYTHYWGNHFTPLGVLREGDILSPTETLKFLFGTIRDLLPKILKTQDLRRDVLYAYLRSISRDTGDITVDPRRNPWRIFENGKQVEIPEDLSLKEPPRASSSQTADTVVYIASVNGCFEVIYRNLLARDSHKTIFPSFEKALDDIRSNVYLREAKIVNQTGLRIPDHWWGMCDYDPHPKNYKK